ncbi:Uu.00g021430.m01.CDS01 [Anthostomella pinea]|uniref:Uu.00g021430.m01.CDS01 n=1 Tax=Anthostomella pinea TaxID=933095 RepID=A0AAI8W0B1_9PEZI|nr:Uu.00g021430.m01.CDS01 [Anthostomella pinea]
MAPSKAITRSDTSVSASLVDPNQTLKATKALLSHMQKASKEKATSADKKTLIEDEESNTEAIWMTLTTKRHIVNSRNLKPNKIVLPNSLNTDPEMGICLITAEPQRHYKNLVASDDFPAEWRKRVTRVIDIAKLKSKYKAYEAQRKLFSEHDIFLGDSRIITRLPNIMGKTFYKTTAKRPIPIEIQERVPKVDGKRVKRANAAGAINACTAPQLCGEIERAVGAALVNLSPTTNTAIRVGHTGLTAEQSAANINAAARVLVEKFCPGKWKNVRSIYVKGNETVALPIYQTDELWLDEQKDIVADGSEEAKALEAKASGEKANVGKKRKSLEGAAEETSPAPKKVKKSKAAKLPESDDSKLNKEIADRKAALKKQKKAAKQALDV